MTQPLHAPRSSILPSHSSDGHGGGKEILTKQLKNLSPSLTLPKGDKVGEIRKIRSLSSSPDPNPFLYHMRLSQRSCRAGVSSPGQEEEESPVLQAVAPLEKTGRTLEQVKNSLNTRERTIQKSGRNQCISGSFSLLTPGMMRRGEIRENPFSHRVALSVQIPFVDSRIEGLLLLGMKTGMHEKTWVICLILTFLW